MSIFCSFPTATGEIEKLVMKLTRNAQKILACRILDPGSKPPIANPPGLQNSKCYRFIVFVNLGHINPLLPQYLVL